MIEAKNLTRRFGDLVAVDDVSFSVEKGQVTGFLGPNGAGKSTTMRLLTGFLAADRGTVRICGHDLATASRQARSTIGYLPEAAGGFSQITVREFLSFCGESRGFWGRELDKAIGRVAEMVALAPAINRKMKELSKGWRQRAWFAQALLHDPPVLILDEPTDGLDPGQKDLVRDLIRSMAPEKAIILSTHILEEAEEICDRAIIIAGGRIVSDAACADLVDKKGRLAGAFRELTGGAAAAGQDG